MWLNCFAVLLLFYSFLFLLLPSYIIVFTVYDYYECVCAFVTYNNDYVSGDSAVTTTRRHNLIISSNEVMFLPFCICLSVRQQDNSKSCRRILMRDGCG